MAGVGTTGYVARALKRDFIMIEIDKKYIDATIERFKKPLRVETKYLKNSKILEYVSVGEIE